MSPMTPMTPMTPGTPATPAGASVNGEDKDKEDPGAKCPIKAQGKLKKVEADGNVVEYVVVLEKAVLSLFSAKAVSVEKGKLQFVGPASFVFSLADFNPVPAKDAEDCIDLKQRDGDASRLKTGSARDRDNWVKALAASRRFVRKNKR